VFFRKNRTTQIDEAEKERETLMRALTELSKRAREKKVLTENQFVTLELVAVIERIVFHGLKNPDTFKGSKPHFWYWIERVSETETSLRPRKECLTLRTSRGRCRSWLRMMMNTNRLASALSVLLKSGNGLEVQLWYETWAALRFEISKKRIMTELEHISKFSFELNFVHAELLDTTEPGIVTQVSSRVITSSSNNEFSKMEEKRKKRPSSFRLGDLRVQNDDDEDDEDVPPLRRSVSRIQDEDIFHNISSSSSTTNTTTSTTKFTLSSKVVVVKGAGLESANGTYIESGTKDDAVRYVYNDLEFFRFRVPGNEDETITHFRWYLGNPERKIVYYYTDVTCKKQDEILHRTISSQTNGTWFAHSDAPKPAPSSVIDPSLLEEEDDNNDNELQPVRIKRKRRNKKRSPVLSPIKFPETPEHRPPGLSLHEEQESEFAISLRVAMLRLENRSDDGSHATTTTTTTTATTVTPTTKASTKIQQQDEEETNVWERVSDEGGSNSSYYYNRRTGKSTWKRPPSMRQSPTTVPIIKMNSTTTKTSSSKTWHSFAEDRRRERAFLAYVEKRRELTDEINTLRKRLASKKSIFVQQKQEVVVEEDPLQSKEWALRLERGDGMSVQYLSVVSAKIFQEPSKHVRYVVRVDAVVEQEQTKRVRVQWNVHRRMAQFKALHAGLRYEILDAPQSLTPPLAPFDTDAHKERIRNRRKSNHNNVPELPVFPSSSWGRSFSDSYIEETKMKLNRYVRCLLGDSKLCEDGVGESVALRMFVREQRPGGYGAPRRRVGCWTGDDGRLHLGLVLERKTEGGHWLSPKERLALQSNKCAGCRRDIEISVFGTFPVFVFVLFLKVGHILFFKLFLK